MYKPLAAERRRSKESLKMRFLNYGTRNFHDDAEAN